MIPAWLVAFLRLVLGALFTFTGITKLFGLRKFSIIIASFGMLPRQLVKPFAYTLPFIETIVGLALLGNVQLPWSALAAVVLMISNQVGIVGALMQKKKIENCGCFGPAIKIPVSWKKFWENMLWLAIAVILTIAAWS